MKNYFLISLLLMGQAMAKTVHDFSVTKIDGTPSQLSEYKGKVLMIVNVASKCGLTPQYEGLEKLYEKYQEKGLVVLGFPANQFLSQEPGSNADIQEFCRTNYGVKFPMHQKIVVKGEGIHPLYDYLVHAQPKTMPRPNGSLIGKLMNKGLFAKNDEDIKWNFEKFLVNKEGKVIERFSPEFDPQDPLIIKTIEKALLQ
jgi:glutathione peroxidase